MSYLVVFVLDDVDRGGDLMDAWEAAGAPGITILDSTGVGRMRSAALRDDLPLIPSLSDLLASEELRHLTVFSVVPDETTVDQLIEVTERLFGDLEEEHTGFLFVVPVVRAVGLRSGPRRR